MTTTELITTTTTLAKEYHFKNEALNLCAAKIAEELNASIEFGVKVLNANNKRDVFLAKVLGTVQESGYYKDDGFKSAAEFAMATFGLEKDYCYKLAQAGKTFYNSESATKQRAVAMIGDSPSKIVELKNVSEEVLTAAMDDGRLHSGMTQKELRDFAKSVKEADSTSKVVNNYTVVLYWFDFALPDNIEPSNEAVFAVNSKCRGQYLELPDVGSAQKLAEALDSDGRAHVVKLSASGDTCMYAIDDTYNKAYGFACVSKIVTDKPKKSKSKTINVLTCTLDEYIVYMDGDVHDDDDRAFYERKLAKVRAQCKPAE